MSPVGHSLVGLAFATVAMAPSRSVKWRVALAIVFVALANLPDWPIPRWGHDRYDISHSVFVNLTLIVLGLVFWAKVARFRSSIPFRCYLLGAGAWLSHLLLDSFYNHGHGVAICWPVSEARLNFSMPWFDTLELSESVISPHNLSVYAIEFLAYSPVLMITVLAVKLIQRRSVNRDRQYQC